MKIRFIALLFSLFLFCLKLSSQDKLNLEYLVIYGQTWGALKYFHPQPSKENWDDVLLKDFDKLVDCKTSEGLNSLISSLINRCGDYKQIKRDVSDTLKIQESFKWLNTNILSNKNKDYLINLTDNKPKFKNRYISRAIAGNPKIINEKGYGVFEDDNSLKYLSITRYWNIINYYYQYLDLIDKSWSDVYVSHLNEFLSAQNYDDYYFAVSHLTTEIEDGHGFIRAEYNPISQYNIAPFRCAKVDEGVFITYVVKDSLNPHQIQRMDKVISIDGKSIEEKQEELGKLISASNTYKLSKISSFYYHLTPKDSIILTVERNNMIIIDTLSCINRYDISNRIKSNNQVAKLSPYGFLTDSTSNKKYAYVHMGRLKRSDITRKFRQSLHSVEYIIIDSRNYPNWTVKKLTRTLIKGRRKFARIAQINFDNPGTYKWSNSQTIGHRRRMYDGYIYVLVDYTTQSQAEYTVMALQQHPNTIVIGGQTAGADGDITEIHLPFGIRSVFSGLGIYYLNGEQTQQTGIKRDFKITQDKSTTEYGRDLIFNKAIELIRLK